MENVFVCMLIFAIIGSIHNCPQKDRDTELANILDGLDKFCKSIGFECVGSKSELADNWNSYYIIHKKLNFSSAYDFCQKEGLELATIESAKERDAIIEAFEYNGYSGSNGEGFWISGYKPKNTNVWGWKSNGREMKYTNWHTGEPNNLFGHENCVGMFTNPENLKYPDQWRDTSCSDTYNFVCQIKGAYPQKP